ncbi:MAG TPA: hypothetical protein VK961_06820 [Chthoniobacter sp.]|nr:hypothetical protein [Chthoniobacter sp.]
MSDAAKYFEAQAVAYARTLPLADSRRFLLGLLESVDDNAFPAIRGAYQNLSLADDQLELISHPQGRLDLNGKEPK